MGEYYNQTRLESQVHLTEEEYKKNQSNNAKNTRWTVAESEKFKELFQQKVSYEEIGKIMREEFGYNFNVILDKKRIREKKSEVFQLIASNKKAKKVLNWKPNYAGVKGFKLGLKKTIEWFQDPKNLQDYNSQSYSI